MSRLVSVFLGVIGIAFVASAASVYFDNAAFSEADGKGTFKHDDYGITLTAAPHGATLTQSDAGIGVNYSRFNDIFGSIIEIPDDIPTEIDYPEVLTISFDKQVNLGSAFISNLFTDELNLIFFTLKWEEEGRYQLSTGEIGNFITGNDDGELTLDINKTVSSISFSAKDGSYLGLLHDFSVRGVEFTSVPEPAMLSLLGISFLCLGFIRNRKN
jgi:hypothetical protein